MPDSDGTPTRTESAFTAKLVPVELLNSLFSERLDIDDGAAHQAAITKTFLQAKLLGIFRGSSLRVFGVEVEKIANLINFRWILRHQDRPPERFFNWQISEQELLSSKDPVTSLLEQKLFASVQRFYHLEEKENPPTYHSL